MKTLVSKYIMGVLVLSSVCLGSLNMAFIANADFSHAEMLHSETDDNDDTSCCDSHDQENKLINIAGHDRQVESPTPSKVTRPPCQPLITKQSEIYTKSNAPPGKALRNHLRSTIRLE